MPLTQRAANRPLDALRLLDLDESVLRFFRDGAALTNDEFEPIHRLLFVLPRLDDVQRHDWRIVPDDWSRVVQNSTEQRANMYQLMGLVLSVRTWTLPAEAARRFGYDHFFELHIASTIDGRTLIVCSREIPESWPSDPSGEPVSCDGLFLKVGEGRAGEESLVFATDRVAWHPGQADPGRKISRGLALLGSQGMDVSRFQDVSHQQPLGPSDRECFYQLLWTVRRMDPAAITRAAEDRSLPVARALQRPDEEVGKVYQLRGVARRALRIQVQDPDIRQRFGIDHYYEIELFTPLEQLLKLVDAHDGQTRYYQNFPVTICAAELPQGMPQGDEVRQAISVNGFFMKLWSYRSQFMTGEQNQPDAEQRRQVSPLLIARSVRLDDVATTPSSTWPAWTTATMIIAGICVIMVVWWWHTVQDRPLRQWRKARSRDVDVTIPEAESTDPPAASDAQ
jgi:hypothetical protein